MQSNILTLLSFVAAVSAHGKVTSPTPRSAGDAFKADCGNTLFNTEKSDPFGNIQQLQQQGKNTLDPTKCQLALCKGYKFEDNQANIESFSAGQKIDFKVEIRAPHTGVANVSVVDTASNSIIGRPMISFTNYASTKTGVAANNTAFSVTMPGSLPAQCATAGNCVVQWWWDSREAGQTYMSCVDFKTSGSGGSDSAPTRATPAAAPAAPADPAAPTSTPPAGAASNSGSSSSSGGGSSSNSGNPSRPASSAPASSCTKRRRARRSSRNRL